MQLNLYQVKNEYLKAFDELSSIEELNNEIIKDTLAPLTSQVEEKITNIAAYIQNLQAEADAMKQYEDTMNKKRKVIENKIQRIKSYIKSNMIECNITKISSPEFNIQIKRCAPSVVVESMHVLPPYLTTVKTEIVPDKALIRKALENGELLEGVRLEEGYSLVIK